MLTRIHLSMEDAKLKEVRDPDIEEKVLFYQKKFDEIRKEIGKIVIGQHEIVDGLIEALISNGHSLVEGIPGIGKTLLVRTLARITGCAFSRIQFTPDLLPTDIVGLTTYEEGRGFFTVKGPIFANFVLADEINRSPPKVQSALLESMQERQATIGKETFKLPAPFFVMATQNPIEQLGTYKLPEAQVDRFLLKILVNYPNFDDEMEIVNRFTKAKEADKVKTLLSKDSLKLLQNLAKQVPIAEDIKKRALEIITKTRTAKDLIEYGASPRASIGLILAAKAKALLNGRKYVSAKDIEEMAYPVLRHRIILNFKAEREGKSPDDVIREIMK